MTSPPSPSHDVTALLQAAELLEVSPATLKRHWNTARAWLRRELTPLPG